MATSTTQTSDAAGERRRARDQRGIRSSQAMKSGDRLPAPPRQRRPALAALAVLLIVGGAAVAALLAMRVDSRVPVLQANQTIYPGDEITAEMFTTTQVAAEDTALVPESQVNDVLGYYASTTIREGQLLDSTMLARTGFLDGGKVAVGAALPVGRYPAEGLRPGDIVDLIKVADGGGEVVIADAQVSSMGGASSAGDDEGATGGANALMSISLIVDRDDAAAVAAANAEGQLSVALVGRGGVGDAEPSAEDDTGGDDSDTEGDEATGDDTGEQG